MSDVLTVRSRPGRQPRGSARRRVGVDARVVAAVGALAACVATVALACVVLPPTVVVLPIVAVATMAVVALRPRYGAYLLIAMTPLFVGINRGSAIPVLRPTEALAALVGAGLAVRGVSLALARGVPRIRPTSIDVALVVLAVASSVLPIMWMVARNVDVTTDDVLYALTLWKFLTLYVIFRIAIRTPGEVRTCLWIAMGVGCIAAAVAMLQALGFPPVTHIIAAYFSPFGNTEAVTNNRGGGTFGLPIAAADYFTFVLAIAVGFLLRGRRLRLGRLARTIGVGLTGVFAAAVVASGEFSAVIGLVIAVVMLAVIERRATLIAYMVPAMAIGMLVLRPVVERRLAGFQSTSGLPVSWTGRLSNLRNYFWPELVRHEHFILGVRVAARVVVPTQATGYVWIESGYTWLLWAGGIPFLLAFLWFTWMGLRRGIAVARSRTDEIGIAGLAASVGLSVVGILMILDQHLTYRGAADLLFALLAMTAVTGRRLGRRRERPDARKDRSRSVTRPTSGASAVPLG
jgi:hypothetical protein